MGIPLNVKKNFKVILKIIILNYYLICNHLRIFACQERVSLSDQATHCAPYSSDGRVPSC